MKDTKKQHKHGEENADELVALQQKNEELELAAKRALADYQNLQRRYVEEKQALSKFATQNLLMELLPLVDHLDQAVITAPEEEKQSGWFTAVAMIAKQLKDLLAREGLEEINPHGEQFDPNQHEVVDVIAGEEPDKIMQVYQKGYALNGKVIRVAKVQVSKSHETKGE